jgi:hypothetical protein
MKRQKQVARVVIERNESVLADVITFAPKFDVAI